MPDEPEPVDAARLASLAALTDGELGVTEEDVKIRFAVPLLEALGHTRLRLEHKAKDILLRDGSPRGSTVVVETKRPDAALDAHLAQLERYAAEERALLAVLTNGHRVRIYSPFWRAPRSFPESLLWDIARPDLASADAVQAIAAVLSHEVLASEWPAEAIRRREDLLEGIWSSADSTRRGYRDRRKALETRLRQIATEAAALADEQRRCEQELSQLGPRERAEIRDFFQRNAWPLVPSGEFGYVLPIEPTPEPAAAPTSRPKRPRKCKAPAFREWTDDDFRKRVTPFQRRIFEAFVRAAKPTLPLKLIAEAVNLRPNAVAAATAPFRYRREYSGRDPVLVHQRVSRADKLRTGDLYTILPRFWPTIQRLYGGAAPRKARRKSSTD